MRETGPLESRLWEPGKERTEMPSQRPGGGGFPGGKAFSNGKAKTPLKKGDNIVVVDGEHAKRCGVVSAMDPDGDMYVRLKEGPKQQMYAGNTR